MFKQARELFDRPELESLGERIASMKTEAAASETAASRQLFSQY